MAAAGVQTRKILLDPPRRVMLKKPGLPPRLLTGVTYVAEQRRKRPRQLLLWNDERPMRVASTHTAVRSDSNRASGCTAQADTAPSGPTARASSGLLRRGAAPCQQRGRNPASTCTRRVLRSVAAQRFPNIGEH
jgi:hypothetical protein